MSAALVNLTIDKYTDFSFQFVWQNPDSSLVNLTGYTGHMEIRDSTGAILWDSASELGGGLVLGGAAGTVTITISNATTTAWTWTSGTYDIVMTSPGGKVTRLVQGSVTVRPGVTH